jgi:hypothetical protein
MARAAGSDSRYSHDSRAYRRQPATFATFSPSSGPNFIPAKSTYFNYFWPDRMTRIGQIVVFILLLATSVLVGGGELVAKVAVFREQAKVNRPVFLTMVTPHGIEPNRHSQQLSIESITLNELMSLD